MTNTSFQIMSWYHRIQERLAITTTECTVIVGACLLFFLGLLVRHFQKIPEPIPEDIYAESDSLFHRGTALLKMIKDSGVVKVDPMDFSPSSSVAPLLALRLDLNAASAEDFEQLPGVGPVIAARIVAYRETSGPFTRIEDLIQVKGIGEKIMTKARPYLFIGKQGERSDTLNH